MAQIIKWPFGPASVAALTATGAQALTIVNNLTVIDGATVEATGNRTLNLTIGSGLEIGARLVIKSKSNGAETLIFGAGITGVTIVGVAGKTQVVEAVYDGTGFVVCATYVQID